MSMEQTEDNSGTPMFCFKSKKNCTACCCSYNNYWKVLWCSVVVTVYLLLGGLFFLLVEKPYEDQKIAEAQEQRRVVNENFLEVLDNVTQVLVDTTPLTSDQVTELTNSLVSIASQLSAANELIPSEVNPIWDFSNSVFFASTVITTIGYGTIFPQTPGGQVLFIFYALLGIPLALILLSAIGSILSDWLNAAVKALLGLCRSKYSKSQVLVRGLGTLLTSTLTLIFFILIPAAIFYAVEQPNNWTYLNSVYYCFVSLTTVGFGDYVAGRETSTIAESTVVGVTGLYRIMSAVWLWIGLALVATLISECQELLEASGMAIRKRRRNRLSEHKMMPIGVEPEPVGVAIEDTDKPPICDIGAEEGDTDKPPMVNIGAEEGDEL